MAVNAGVVRAVRLLQQLCGVDDDGLIGPLTLAAVQRRPPADLIAAYSRLRLTYYRSLQRAAVALLEGMASRSGHVEKLKVVPSWL